jgi:AraC-like DNA-binding protein
MVRHREQRRADRRDQQQHALDPPWSKTVEEDADGYLGGSEGHEVNRREQAQIVGTEPQFGRQWDRHDRIDRPEQIGDELSVTAIALDIGFSDTSTFTAAFHRLTGQTPSSYRRNLD